ncbi:MAG: site-specific DNA-methyltransferase, partial [Clostridia bacterium]|nr:site-specific DNA-methyltransferase [Clostridia bacterium]
MDKLDMQSKNLVDGNIDKIAKLFPNCITEGKNEDGKVVKLVDFDLLKQELSKEIVEGNDERYTLNWAGKKQAILTANSPINATLRPYVEESVGKDGTPGGFDSQNLYIEGDNL